MPMDASGLMVCHQNQPEMGQLQEPLYNQDQPMTNIGPMPCMEKHPPRPIYNPFNPCFNFTGDEIFTDPFLNVYGTYNHDCGNIPGQCHIFDYHPSTQNYYQPIHKFNNVKTQHFVPNGLPNLNRPIPQADTAQTFTARQLDLKDKLKLLQSKNNREHSINNCQNYIQKDESTDRTAPFEHFDDRKTLQYKEYIKYTPNYSQLPKLTEKPETAQEQYKSTEQDNYLISQENWKLRQLLSVPETYNKTDQSSNLILANPILNYKFNQLANLCDTYRNQIVNYKKLIYYAIGKGHTQQTESIEQPILMMNRLLDMFDEQDRVVQKFKHLPIKNLAYKKHILRLLELGG